MTENESMIDFGQMSDTSKMDTPTVQPKVQLPLTTTLLQVFLLVTTIALLHFASLSYPLTADSPDIINNSVLQSYVQDLKDPANYSQPYSIIKLSYIIDYALFGTSASGFRLVNVLLHTLNTILLFFFLFLLLINVSQEQEGKQELSTLSWASFCVALLFAVHPLSVFATTYVIQRPILLATFYCLLSLLAFFQGVLKQKFVWFFLSALAYGFALYSSERALFFMFVPLLFLPLIVTAEKGRASYVFVMILINLLTAIQFTASQWSGLALVHEPWMNKLVAYASPDIANKLFSASLDSASYHMSLLQQAWLYFRYLFLSFFPDLKQLTVLVPISPPTSWFSGPELFGCLLFVLYPIGPIKLISRKGFLGIVGAALFIPWILFIPELTINQLETPFVLSRAYLGLIGSTAVFLSLLLLLPYRAKWAIMLVFCALMALTTFNRIHTFRDSVALWSDTCQKISPSQLNQPSLYKPFFYLGNHLAQAGQYSRAIEAYQTSIQVQPLLAPAYFNMGLAYFKISDYQKAIASLLKASALSPENYSIYFHLGNTYQMLQDHAQAVKFYNMSINLNSVHLGSHVQLGVSLFESDQLDAAFEKFQKLIKLDSKNGQVHDYFGRVLLKKNQLPEALESFRIAHELLPNDKPICFHIAQIEWTLGNKEQALLFVQKALDDNPNFVEAKTLLGEITTSRQQDDVQENKHKKKQ